MIRLSIRVIAYFSLALAVITAVLDLTKSIADSAISIKPLGLAWLEFSPNTLNDAQAFISGYLHPIIWDPIIQKLLLAPSWVIFGVIWFVLSMITRKRHSRFETK